MNKIISKERFSEKVFKFEIEAPLIAKSRKAGHFVIVRVGEKGERMPLTIAGSDLKKGTITLVVQEVGLSSTRLCELNEGESITDVVGQTIFSFCSEFFFFRTNIFRIIVFRHAFKFANISIIIIKAYTRTLCSMVSTPFFACL